MPTIDPSPTDQLALRELLVTCARLAGSHEVLARLLGVCRSAVTQWIGGQRTADAYAVLAAVRAVAALHPSHRVELVGRVVSILDVGPGHWVSEEAPSEPDRSIPDRVLEVVGLGGSLAGEARVALADQVLDPQERRRLVGLVEDQRRALDDLAAQLRASPVGAA